MSIAGQQQGSLIASIVIDVNTDKVISAYGIASAGLTTVTPKTEYTFGLDPELTACVPDQREELAEVRTFDVNPARLARVYVKAGDDQNTIRVQLIDGAFAPAAGAAGDVLIVSVLRAAVPQF